MKIYRVKAEEGKKTSRKDSFFLNIYYFLCLYRYLAFAIIGIALSTLVYLFILDLMIPSTMEKVDRKATLKLFDQLQMANRHQAAISLMEYKGDIITDNPHELEYKSKLADSYVHIGDYSKAEKMLFDVWNNSNKYLEEYWTDDSLKRNTNEAMLKFGLARLIYQLYEKMGDKKNQVKFYNIYKSYHDKLQNRYNLDSIMGSIYNDKTFIEKQKEFNIAELIQYDSIVVLSFKDESSAIRQMECFIDKVIDRKEYTPAFKVKCINQLVKWYLKSSDETRAYPRIAQAIEQVKLMKFEGEYKGLGELSDYCFQLHDIKTSRALYNRYQKYLDSYYTKTDLEYLSNYIRTFRYLEADGNLDQLTDELMKYSIGMRKQIAINIPSMSEEQREYFAKQFDAAYTYAFQILQRYPSQELANLCFDNVTFKTGLLLRSNLAIKNSISRMNDANLNAMYQELVNKRNDLILNSITGRRFLNKEAELESRINELEKNIALLCTDFKTKNEILDYTSEVLGKKLDNDEAIIELIEHKGYLSALILRNNNGVTYTPLCAISDIREKLQRPIFELYHDVELTAMLWSKIEAHISDCNNIYYLPTGIFNQISIGALYLGNNEYLCDSRNLYLLSNPADIVDKNEMNLTDKISQVSLWGGINYEYEHNDNAYNIKQKRTAIKRGEKLNNLNYAYQEVTNIASMLDENSIRNYKYSSDEATELSFKNRSGKGDYILHVSTHGFFNDKANLSTSMYESGLFFAGANKYWTNDTIIVNEYEEDGILRSAEIANLNLTGCSLVVLSACETGLGFNDSSEGVYGLQRAFKLAGAKHILMSLWNVDDEATSLLMTSFYKYILEGIDTLCALEKAQREIRELYPSPEAWGGFVLLN